ncbi:hypothetical protein ACFL04_01510 [Patescibacteria group bacterium]
MAHATWLLIHFIGLAISLGSVFVVDVMWFIYEREKKYSHFLVKFSPIMSMMVWVGLILLITSGIFLTAERPDYYLTDARFQMKLILVLLLVANGVYLNLRVGPRIQELTPLFHEEATDKYYQLKTRGVVSGVISLFSWIGAIVFAVYKNIDQPLINLLIIFIAIVLTGVGVGAWVDSIAAELGRRQADKAVTNKPAKPKSENK